MNDPPWYIKMQVIVYLSDCFVCFVSGCESDESVAAVHPGHGVHHEAKVPDLSTFLEEGNQVVLVNVARNFAAENLNKSFQIRKPNKSFKPNKGFKPYLLVNKIYSRL